MSTIVTRAGKGSALTHAEGDANFTNLNNDKIESNDVRTLTNKTISADSNTLSGIAASSFVLSNASGNIDGSAAQKAIPTGVVVGDSDTQTLTNKSIDLTNNTLTATSAQLATAISDETGTGALVFADSPALAGTPTTPTAIAGTNTTQIASTAHVFAERSNTATLTNKTISLTSNTVSGTTAEFNAALSDNDFATLAGTETLTNKTVSVDSNTVSGIAASSFVLSDASGNIDGTAAQKAIPSGVVVGTTDAQTLSGKSISLTSNTVTGTAAEFDTACTDDNFFFQSDVVTTVLAQCGVPGGVAPSGTIGNNGALTLGTALNQTYSTGIWLYFPADAIETGSAAGWYWTVMSSTTAGTIYNNTRVSTDFPVIISSPTAFVTTGPGAYTGGAGLAEMTWYEVTNTGGAMGPNGIIESQMLVSYTNSAGSKYYRTYLGSSAFQSAGVSTTASASFHKIIRNHGSETQQVTGSVFGNEPYFGSANALVDFSENTASNTQVSLRTQVAAATDFAIIDAFDITRTYSA